MASAVRSASASSSSAAKTMMASFSTLSLSRAASGSVGTSTAVAGRAAAVQGAGTLVAAALGRRGMATTNDAASPAASTSASTSSASSETTDEATAASSGRSSSRSSSSSSPLDYTLRPWSPFSRRVGVIARKRGMTALFCGATGERRPVTVLQLEDVQVVRHEPPPPATEGQGQSTTRFSRRETLHQLQLGAGTSGAKSKKSSKSALGHLRRAREAAAAASARSTDVAGAAAADSAEAEQQLRGKAILRSFRVSADALLPVGTTLSALHFVPGQRVDVTADSIGKGFAGAMKRHGFSGLKASHGVSLTHRSAGSTGQHQDPGRVLPGKKMAGHMGTTRTTIQNLRVLRVDARLGLVFVHGHVPGPDDAQVLVRDAVKMVEHKSQAAVRKGKDEGEWLAGGIKGLPFPGMSVEMAKRLKLPEVVEVVE